MSLCRASNHSQLGRGLLVDPEHAGGIIYTLAPEQLWLPLEELDRLYQRNNPSLKGREMQGLAHLLPGGGWMF